MNKSSSLRRLPLTLRTATRRAYTTAQNERRPTQPPKKSRLLRVAFGAAVVGGSVLLYDRYYWASSLVRSSRTAWFAAMVALDYKVNFSKDKNAEELNALHERVASRLHDLIMKNQGLYIKLGQSVAVQGQVLPKPFRVALANIFDSAPPMEFEDVLLTLNEEFNIDSPLEMFEEFNPVPIASASIASVYRARLKSQPGEERGQEVAVKVQRREIPVQMEMDLLAYRGLAWMLQLQFEMPVVFIADYVTIQMRKELSFLNEARNSIRTNDLIQATPSLKDDIIIPKVYKNLSSDRVMTTEYIDGACQLTDEVKIEKMGLSKRTVMDIVLNTFSAMIFVYGFLHSDPHPGNLLVRPNPSNKRKPQVVLLDHGLYIEMDEKFREQYCNLWRSMFVLDTGAMVKIAKAWGINLPPDLFASSILLRPTHVTKGSNVHRDKDGKKTDYEKELEVKQRLKNIFENEKLELTFLGRTQRMLQANNQSLGSPSPRINITAKWAIEGFKLSHQDSRPPLRIWKPSTVGPWVKDFKDGLVFRTALLSIDVGFYSAKIYQYISALRGVPNEGFESSLQRKMEKMAKEEMGIDLDSTSFEG